MFQHRDKNYTAHHVKLRKNKINNELVGEMYLTSGFGYT